MDPELKNHLIVQQYLLTHIYWSVLTIETMLQASVTHWPDSLHDEIKRRVSESMKTIIEFTRATNPQGLDDLLKGFGIDLSRS